MTRRKRRAKPLPRRPLPKPGESVWRCPSTAQNNRSASAASRCLLAWERLLRLGGVAPRKAESGPLCSRRASQTSLRPSACEATPLCRTEIWGASRRQRMEKPVSSSLVPKKYDEAFRRHAVELVLHGGKTVKQVADDLGVSPYSIYEWKRK